MKNLRTYALSSIFAVNVANPEMPTEELKITYALAAMDELYAA